MQHVEVLPENWEIVQVFMQCQPQLITGMHKPIYAGITSLELQAACQLLQVPRHALPDVTAGVRVMAQTTNEIYRAP